MFLFKLQSVLDYRKTLEEKCLVEYSDSLKYLEKEKNILETLKRRKEVLMNQFLKMQEGDLNSSEIASYVSFIRHMTDKERGQQAAVRKAEEVVEKKRVELLEAVKKRKVMENLKERKKEEYRSEVEAKERKEMDEFGITKFQSKVESEETDHSL
ncbi:MAG: flagellar export protein FliJ [Syntrophales bacterium]